MVDLRLHVVPLSDQQLDGSGLPARRFAVTPLEFAELIDRMNVYFRDAGIRFVFEPETDWRPMVDTELNSDGPNMRARGNAMAAGVPGKVLCLLRWGPDEAIPTGNGNAYPPPGAGPLPRNLFDLEQNYIALPSQIGPGGSYLNLGQGTFLAHEFGHYMGLYHTFPGWSDQFGPIYNGTRPMNGPAADVVLVDYVMRNGGTIDAVDGDGISDTPPDPSPILFRAKGQDECANPSITVSAVWGGAPQSFTFRPDPTNLMSYFGGCAGRTMSFSPQQWARMQQTLGHAKRQHLTETPCWPDFHDLPADQFQNCFNYWANRGWWPATLSMAVRGGGTYASGSFQRGRGRRVRSLMSVQEFEAERDAQRPSGQRPHQINVVDTGAGPRYTVLWGPARGEWRMEIGMDLAAYNALWFQLRADKWVQVELAIAGGSQPRATSVWEKRPFDDYASYVGMTASEYQTRFNQFWGTGLKPVRFCRYVDGNAERFAAIWERLPGPWAHYFGMDAAAYQTHWQDFAGGQRFRLYQMHSYDRWFSAIWHVPGIGRWLGGALTSGPTATSRGRQRLDVFYRATDKSAHWISTDGGAWSRPQSLLGELESGPSAAARGDSVEVAAQGTDGRLYVNTLHNSRWSGWNYVGDVMGSAPAVCSWAPDRLDVFYRGPGGDLVQRTHTGSWGTATSRGGTLTSRPTAVSWSPGRFDVFARGADNALWHIWYDGTWRTWESLGGGLRSAPAVCSWGPNRLDVFARGTDDALWHTWYDGRWNAWESLGGTLVDDPAATSWGPDRIDVFATGTDGAVWRKSYDSTWID